MAAEAVHRRVAPAPAPGRPRVAFVCPFNLGRSTGTPVRARTTIDAVQRVADVGVVAIDDGTGRGMPDVWQPRAGRAPRFRLDRFTLGALRRLRRLGPEVVHAIGVGVLPALLYGWRRPGVRVVFEVHGLAAYELPKARPLIRRVFSAVDQLGLRGSDAIVAMSYTQHDFLVQQLGVRAAKIHVLWGPVDVDLFAYRPPPPAPPFRIGYSGSDVFWHGLETVHEAARLLRPRSDIAFVLAGFDPGSRASNGVGNVEIAGVLSRPATAEFLARCHVLLSPRIAGPVSETQYPHKLSAYLAVGRPVIASAVNDQPRILEAAGCGIAVPAGNASALADAIARIVGAAPEERVAMGERARRFAEANMSLVSLTERLTAIYAGRG